MRRGVKRTERGELIVGKMNSYRINGAASSSE